MSAVGIAVAPELAPFWEGVAAGELRLPRCERCGGWQWYPLAGVAHSCGGALRWTAIPPIGTLFSFTVVRRPFLPGATRDDVPLTTGLVELDAAPGVRLVARLGDDPSPEIGGRVEGRFSTVPDPPDLRFVPISRRRPA